MTPDDLPDEIKKLSLPAQLKYFMVYNNAVDLEEKTPEESHKIANDSIQVFITSKEKVVIKGKEEKTVVCKNCSATFDYGSVPEISMGSIECPICYATIDQIGTVYSTKEEIKAPFNNIDELPDNVKNVLPIPAQMIWMKVFNSIFEETGDEVRAIRGAWSEVGKTYEKVPNKKKWIKKAQLEDYKSEMSSYAYKIFEEMYDSAFEHCSLNQNSIKTALAIIERVCTKNKDGIWVKDKTLTKSQIEKIDRPDFVDKMLELELTEKKLKLIDKLLNEDK